MRIILKSNNNERQFIVKIKYDSTKPTIQTRKDEYGRAVYTIWNERRTTVTCREWCKGREPVSKTLYEGSTVCHYSDKYDKQYGKSKAWDHCVEEMVNQGVITGLEGNALVEAGLSGCVVLVDADKFTSKILK